jgi:Ca2+-binding EF-hand superfamily protein
MLASTHAVCRCAVDIEYIDAIWRRLYGDRKRDHKGTVEQIRKRIKNDEQLANCVFVLLFNGSEGKTSSSDLGSASLRKDVDAMLTAMDDSHSKALIDIPAYEASSDVLKEAKMSALARLKDAVSGDDAEDLFDAMADASKLGLTGTDDFAAAVAKVSKMKEDAAAMLTAAANSCQQTDSKERGNASGGVESTAPADSTQDDDMFDLYERDTEGGNIEQKPRGSPGALENDNSSKNDTKGLSATRGLEKEEAKAAIEALKTATDRAQALHLEDTPGFESATKNLADLKQKGIEELRVAIEDGDIEHLMRALEIANASRSNDSTEYSAAVEALKNAKIALAERLGSESFDSVKEAIGEAEKAGLGDSPECKGAKERLQGMKKLTLERLSAATDGNNAGELIAAIESAKLRDLNDTPEMKAALAALDAEKAKLLAALKDAAADGDVDKLLSATKEAFDAGLENTPEYEAAIAALDKAKKGAMDKLLKAIESEEPTDLIEALAEAEKMGLMNTAAFEEAGDILDSAKERAIAHLKEAVSYEDAGLLLAAIAEADELGLRNTPAFTEAALKVEELQGRALTALSEATPWDVDALKKTLKLASRLGLAETDEYKHASDMLESAKAKALAALKAAAAAADVGELNAAMSRAEDLDLEKSSEYKEAASTLQSLKDKALAALKEALLSGSIDDLIAACESAKALRLDDTSEYSDAVNALAAAKAKTLEKLKDLDAGIELASAIEDASKLGLCDTPEFKAASDALNAAREAVKDKALADKAAEDAKAAAEKAAEDERLAKEKAEAEAKVRAEKLKKLFDACDKQSKTCISQSGLLAGFSEQKDLKIDLGFPSETTLEFFEDLFYEAKTEEDSVVTFIQFEIFYKKMRGGSALMPLSWEEIDAILRAFFNTCDADNSGAISKPEFLNGLWEAEDAQRVFNFPKTMDTQELDALWKIMDSDESGEITYEELYQYYVLYWRTVAKLNEQGTERPSFSSVIASMAKGEFKFTPEDFVKEDDELPDPEVALLRSWSVSSRNVYNDNLQKFDENLLKSEKAAGNLKKLKAGIKFKTNMNDLFDALPRIADAIDTLNRGVGGNHDFLTAAFQHSDRLQRLKVVLLGSYEGSEDWCVANLIKSDDLAQSGMHTKAVSRLTKSYHAVTKVSTDTRGSRTSLTVRSVEESGINTQENKVVASLMRRQSTRGFEGQAQSMFDTHLGKVDENLALALTLCDAVSKTAKSDRSHIKSRKSIVELAEKLGILRDEMKALVKVDIEAAGRSFAPDSTRLAKMKKLVTGGVEFESIATGGIFFLMKDDPENMGQESFRTVSDELKKAVQSATGAASDSAKVGLQVASSLKRTQTANLTTGESEVTEVSITINGIPFEKLKADAQLAELFKSTVVEEAASILGDKYSKDAVKASVSEDKGSVKMTISVSHPKSANTTDLNQKLSASGPILIDKVTKKCGL